MQLRAAIMPANPGRHDEAVEMLQKLLQQHPDFDDGYVTLGGIHLYRGNLQQASPCFETALALRRQRTNGRMRI